MNKVGVFIGIISIILVSSIIVVYYRASITPIMDGRVRVVASFYPMAFFASRIAGDLADIITVTPAGVEPHDYEPSPTDSSAMQHANIIIVNGNVEPWANSIKENLAGSHVRIVTASAGISRGNDPHVWLDPVLAKQEVAIIAQAFQDQDPQHVALYQQREQQLMSELDALDASYRTGLAHCIRKDIVTSHAAFGYLAQEYGLQQVAIAGLSPDEEPSVKQLSDVADIVRKNDVGYIFFESLVSPKLSDTIATETGAQTLPLNPLEGLTTQEQEGGNDYFSVMQNNLHNIQLALQCR